MLTIRVGSKEALDEATNTFVQRGGTEIHLEHSLVALSKWESKHEKPFLDKEAKTPDEILDYIRFMVVGNLPPEDFVTQLSEKNAEEIQTYMDAPMTATWFSKTREKPSTETITSELIYYWMTAYRIPWEAQHWHINRLFTLIRVHNIKQDKPKKMSRSEQLRQQQDLNRQRRERMKSKG